MLFLHCIREREREEGERDSHLNDVLPLESLNLAGPPLPVTVAMAQFAVVSVAPREHLPTLSQR